MFNPSLLFTLINMYNKETSVSTIIMIMVHIHWYTHDIDWFNIKH